MTAATTGDAPPAKVLEFRIDDERYCVDIETVAEIVQPSDITTMPDTPPEVEGVMKLRGKTTTVLEPGVVFGAPGGATEKQKVIVFDSGGDQPVGWLVTHVDRVTELADPDVDPVPENRYVSGIVSDDEQFVLWVEPSRVNDPVELVTGP